MHNPSRSFGEAAKNYPGLPNLRAVLVAVLVAAVVVGGLLFYPRSPSPDEWATKLAEAVVVDGTMYGNEPGATEARARILAAIEAWKEDSGCRLVGGNGIRADTRAEVRADVDQAVAKAEATFPGESIGVGYAIADRGKDYGGAVIVADCTKEAPPMSGPFGQ